MRTISSRSILVAHRRYARLYWIRGCRGLLLNGTPTFRWVAIESKDYICHEGIYSAPVRPVSFRSEDRVDSRHGRLCGCRDALLTRLSGAEDTLTPAQALNFRSIADLHLSPDGSKLAYVVYSYQWDWLPQLWLMDVATGNARKLTPEKKSDRSPEWSPNGETAGVSFQSRRQDTGIYDFCRRRRSSRDHIA